MQKNRLQNIHTASGFTLIELLVVIAIIGIIASVIMVTFGAARAQASRAGGEIFEDSMRDAYGANALAEWNFDEATGTAALDLSGNHNDIAIDISTADGPAVSWADSAHAFRGASALTIPLDSSALSPASVNLAGFDASDGSLSFWINLAAASDQAGIFCNGSDITLYAQFCVFSSDTSPGNFIDVEWRGGGAGKSLVTSIPTDSVIGTWTHVALSWNVPAGSTAGTMNIYVNGHMATSTAYVPSQSLGSAPSFCVGGDCFGDNMAGTIDEMRVYSQSLQSAEIKKIYAEELPAHAIADAYPADYPDRAE